MSSLIHELTGWLRLGGVVLTMLASTSLAADPPEPAAPAAGQPADFYVDVYPLLEAKCLACHSRTRHEAELVLEDVASILKGGASGPAVVPHQPDQSLLFRVCARVDEPAMPPLPNRVGATAVTPQELDRLKNWIEAGAQPGRMNPSAAAIGWQALPSTMTASFAMALGPRDRFVALGRANAIVIGDLLTGQEIARLGDPLIRTVKTPSLLPLYDRDVAHFDVVSSLAFSPDGDLLASGGYREIKIWQRQRDSVTARIDTGVAVSRSLHGERLLIGREDGSFGLWDLEDASESSAPDPQPGLAHVALLSRRRAISLTQAGQATLYDLAEKRELLAWPTGQPVTAVAVLPGGEAVLTGHPDGAIQRWNLPQELPEKLETAAAKSAPAAAAVRQLALTADGTLLVAAFADGKVVSLGGDLQGPKPLLTVPAESTVLALSASGPQVVSIAAAAKTATLQRVGQSADRSLSAVPVLANRIRQLDDDRTVALARKAGAEEAVKGAQKELDERTTTQMAAEKTREEAAAALMKAQTAADEAEAALKQAQDQSSAAPDDEALKKAAAEAEKTIKAPREAVASAREALTAAERNSRFADTSAQAARQELNARRVELESRENLLAAIDTALAEARTAVEQSEVRILSASISADGRLIVTGHSDGVIHLWAADDGRWLESFTGQGAAVEWLALGDDHTLLSAGRDGTTLAWNLAPEWKLAGVIGTTPENRLDVGQSPLTDRVLALQFSPDGRLLASGGGEPSRGGEVLLWDVGSLTVQRELRELHSDTVNSLAFSRDGRLLATASADKFVRLTEVETGRLLRTLEGHTAHVLGVAWSANANTLSSGGADGALKIWNTETGEQRKSVAATPGQVTAVAPVGLTEQVLIANNKGQCQLYDFAGKLIRTYPMTTGYLYQAAATHDGQAVLAAGEDGILRSLNFADAKPIQEFKP